MTNPKKPERIEWKANDIEWEVTGDAKDAPVKTWVDHLNAKIQKDTGKK